MGSVPAASGVLAVSGSGVRLANALPISPERPLSSLPTMPDMAEQPAHSSIIAAISRGSIRFIVSFSLFIVVWRACAGQAFLFVYFLNGRYGIICLASFAMVMVCKCTLPGPVITVSNMPSEPNRTFFMPFTI